MTDWFSEKIARLSDLNDDEEKRNLLSTMRIKLSSLTPRELDEIACNLDLTGLFAQLTSNDRFVFDDTAKNISLFTSSHLVILPKIYVFSELIEEICNNLQSFLSAFEPGEALRRYPTEIHRYIAHSESAPKIIILKELKRIVENSEKLPHFLNDTNLVNRVVEAIGDKDLAVAQLAMEIIKKLGSTPGGTKVLYSGTPMRTIAKMLVDNDAASFRVYEVVTDIAASCKEGLEASASSGFLNSLINLLDNEDVLLQLNALECMRDLALSEEGLNYLEQRDVLRRLAEKIARANEDPLSSLLIPGLMKFFGGVARSRPTEIFSKYPAVVCALFEVIESGDGTLLSNALDTLGFVASSVDGKYGLQLLCDSMPRAMKRIAEILQNMPMESRLSALENLALIIGIDKKEQDNRVLSLTKSWFDALGDDPLDIIVRLCKLPFPDIRQASLNVLVTISTQTWGQEYIANYPGLVEFLLDRNVEAFKNCKDLKYQLVKNLCDSDADVFDSGTMQRLKTYLRQGPFYVDTETEIATEGAT